MKFRLTNGTEVDVPDDAIDRAYLTRHPATPPAAPAANAPALDPNIVALRETVQSMTTQLADERRERQTEHAQSIVDALITKGKVKPADRDRMVNLYLADRQTFNFVSTTLQAAPGMRVRSEDGGDGEFGSGEGGDEGDFALNEGAADNGRPTPITGADARWDREIARIARTETKGDVREAANILQLREPDLYHRRREEFAGHRLPKVVPRNNRHTSMGG